MVGYLRALCVPEGQRAMALFHVFERMRAEAIVPWEQQGDYQMKRGKRRFGRTEVCQLLRVGTVQTSRPDVSHVILVSGAENRLAVRGPFERQHIGIVSRFQTPTCNHAFRSSGQQLRRCVLVRGARLRFNLSWQLRVFRFGLFKDRNVGIGIFPESEKILIGGAGA